MAEDGQKRAIGGDAGVIDVPWNLVVPSADLYLVGYGMRMPNDFTLEMLAVLKQCKRVFGVPPLHAPAFGIPPMENLFMLYSPHKVRLETYREMETLVLEAASAEPPVAFATYGSAMVGTQVAHRLLQEAPRRGLTVRVTNTVSSFDGIWADFNIEPFFGFHIWEASGFVTLGIEPDTQANLLLPQAPFFKVKDGPDPSTLSMRVSSTMTALRDHLLRFYPPEHEVHFIKTGSGYGARSVGPVVETLRLDELDHPAQDSTSTLLVPRLRTALVGTVALDFDRPDHAGVASAGAVPAGHGSGDRSSSPA